MITAWIIYWIALFAIGLGPAIAAAWRASHGPSGQDNTITASFDNTVLSLKVVEHGATTYAGSIHLLAAALWIAGPPLVLWALWLVATRRERHAVEA
jgi:hypothetical protein